MPEINLLILDFDGVLTDNKVYVFEDGREAVVCHRGDGWGIRMLQSVGIEVIILSTETNAVVSARAEKLNVTAVRVVKIKGQLCSRSLTQGLSIQTKSCMLAMIPTILTR